MKDKIIKYVILGVSFCSLSVFGKNTCNECSKFVADSFHIAPRGSVEMNGTLGKYLKTSLNGNILVWDIDALVRPFKERKETIFWQCEFWGKWYTSAELAYDFQPSEVLDKRLKYGASELIKTQDECGSITSYTKARELLVNADGGLGNNSSWDIWGRKYVLLGLLAEYNRTKDITILNSARKHADYILNHVGNGKREIVQIGCWEGLASSSILEPMVLLYKETGDKRYLDFCEWIVETWQTNPLKPDIMNKALKEVPVFDMFAHPIANPKIYIHYGKSKAYEMMSCFEGLTELYRATSKTIYKEAVEKVIASIRDREITVLGSGSMHERWSNGAFEQQRTTPYWQETCVTATWLKFATQLLRLTGDVKYANDIEITAYNSLIGAQGADGSWWSHYNNMSGTRSAAPEHCGMHMNCCVANGPRALFLLPKVAYMTAKNAIVVNFYENGKATIPIENSKVELLVSAPDYINNNTAEITLNGIENKTHKFELKLRIPNWSKNTTASVNGEKLENIKAGEYLNIVRQFKNGDKICLNFDVETKVVRDTKNPKFFVLKHGPFVLSQDRRFSKGFDNNVKIKLNNDKVNATALFVKGTNVAVDVEMEDGTKRRFIDYASAGSTWNSDSEFKIWNQ